MTQDIGINANNEQPIMHLKYKIIYVSRIFLIFHFILLINFGSFKYNSLM